MGDNGGTLGIQADLRPLTASPASLVVMRAARYQIGFAPAVPHFANLPLAAFQRASFAGAEVGHFINLPLALRHGATSAGVESSAIEAAPSIILWIMVISCR